MVHRTYLFVFCLTLSASVSLVSSFAGGQNAILQPVGQQQPQVNQENQDNQEDQDKIEVGPGTEGKLDSVKTLTLAAVENMKFKIMYKEEVFDDDTIKIRFSEKMSMTPEELFQLTQTILRARGLAIVDTDNPGLKQVIQLTEIRPFAPERKTEGAIGGEYLTQVFKLESIQTAKAIELIDKFFNQQRQADSQTPPITDIPDRRLLIVTETATNIKKIEALLKRFDVPADSIVIEFRKVEDVEAEEIVNSLTKILDLKQSAEGQQQSTIGFAENVSVTAETRTNRIVLIGPKVGVGQVNSLIDELFDEKVETKTVSYRFQFITAARMDELIRRSLGNLDEKQLAYIYKSVIDKQTNQLIVTARNEIHKRIVSLKSQLDKQPKRDEFQSPVQYYKLKHVKATEILKTIQSVERNLFGNRSPRTDSSDSPSRNSGFNSNRGVSRIGDSFSNEQGQSKQVDPIGQGLSRNPERFQVDNAFNQYQDNQDPSQFLGQPSVVNNQLANWANQVLTKPILPGNAQVTVDENSNQLIVIAEPAVQRLYKEMIEKLDRPRPQVLIYVTVVTIDRSDNAEFGIEISTGDRTGAKKLFAFTQYGLSTVDPTNGALSIIPGLGFNGTMIDADVADIVLRSLATHARARVVAAPRILVNDNATGVLSSVAEVPYSQVNASQTVATTSLGGFAEAGTTISVSPQIGEGDNLNLEFDVIVSDFTESDDTDLPPPRRSDQVTSTVTIPDGHTVIVGGLKRNRDAESRRGLPFVENIPVFRLLTGSAGVENANQNIYIFIKPVILRDDKFRDLQFISQSERRQAYIPDDLPKSCPLLIKIPTP